jgi:hypothetical protein
MVRAHNDPAVAGQPKILVKSGSFGSADRQYAWRVLDDI